MTNPIVQVNVNVTNPPAPSTLQGTGAVLSQGGTILNPQDYRLLVQPSDLTAFLPAALALTSITWAATYGGQATATATVAHGVPVGQQFITTIVGAVPVGYNGTFLATATGASTFTYYLSVNPGTSPAGTPGTYTRAGVGDLQAAVATFFAQGNSQPCYVLELGAGAPAAGVTALSSFITNSPQFFYSYLVPKSWDGVASFLTFLAGFEATTAKTYFFVTTTQANYALYTPAMKDVILMMEAPAYGVWPQNGITAATFSTPNVTATTTTPHGVIPGQTFTIAGVLPVGYNGTFVALPGTTGSSLVYAVGSALGSYISGGNLLASLYTSAGVAPAEYSHASDWFDTLNYDPSTTNKVTPLNSTFLFGVTPFPTRGNAALLATLGQANVELVGSGAAGGLSGNILVGGHTLDGNPFNYWYSVDWMQINIALNLTNEIINGSNNPINPLYYNQDGINRLQLRAASTGASAITFGLALGQVIQTQLDGPSFTAALNAGQFNGQLVVNAVPFVPYLTASPSDYSIGKYAGLAMVYTPLRGFDNIIFNINVTNFVAGA